MATDEKIKAACRVVGCKVKELLASRLTEDSVVLIVGPAGGKHIVLFSDLGLADVSFEVGIDLAGPPPVTTQVEADEPPVKAAKKKTRRPASKSKA